MWRIAKTYWWINVWCYCSRKEGKHTLLDEDSSKCWVSWETRPCATWRWGWQIRKLLPVNVVKNFVWPSLLTWINRSYDRHLSSTSQSEIHKLLALKRLCKIASDISITCCFSTLADEATDVSHTHQLVVCIRWVTNDLEAEEDFTCLVPVERAQADVIAAAVKNILMRLLLPISNAITQCYDGCSTMVGSKKV